MNGTHRKKSKSTNQRGGKSHNRKHTVWWFIHLKISVCVCVCVCMCMSERETEWTLQDFHVTFNLAFFLSKTMLKYQLFLKRALCSLKKRIGNLRPSIQSVFHFKNHILKSNLEKLWIHHSYFKPNYCFLGEQNI